MNRITRFYQTLVSTLATVIHQLVPSVTDAGAGSTAANLRRKTMMITWGPTHHLVSL